MNRVECIVREALDWGLDDWVFVGSFSSFALRCSVPRRQDETITENALAALRVLLTEELMVAGDLPFDRLRPWTVPPIEAAAIIEQRWHALGRLPTLGDDLPWLEITPAGLNRLDALRDQQSTDIKRSRFSWFRRR